MQQAIRVRNQSLYSRGACILIRTLRLTMATAIRAKRQAIPAVTRFHSDRRHGPERTFSVPTNRAKGELPTKFLQHHTPIRSEERRVGKECRSRRRADHEKK